VLFPSVERLLQGALERFQAKWIPVRVKKTRQNKSQAFAPIQLEWRL
jgi:hypothetical protein